MNQLQYPKFISAQKLLVDKFTVEFSYNDKNNNIRKRRTTIELNLGAHSLLR